MSKSLRWSKKYRQQQAVVGSSIGRGPADSPIELVSPNTNTSATGVSEESWSPLSKLIRKLHSHHISDRVDSGSGGGGGGGSGRSDLYVIVRHDSENSHELQFKDSLQMLRGVLRKIEQLEILEKGVKYGSLIVVVKSIIYMMEVRSGRDEDILKEAEGWKVCAAALEIFVNGLSSMSNTDIVEAEQWKESPNLNKEKGNSKKPSDEELNAKPEKEMKLIKKYKMPLRRKLYRYDGGGQVTLAQTDPGTNHSGNIDEFLRNLNNKLLNVNTTQIL
jgi:hypothetical protein